MHGFDFDGDGMPDGGHGGGYDPYDTRFDAPCHHHHGWGFPFILIFGDSWSLRKEHVGRKPWSRRKTLLLVPLYILLLILGWCWWANVTRPHHPKYHPLVQGN